MAALHDEKWQIRKTKLLRDRDDPGEWLEKELQVAFLDGTDIARIALSGPDPDELPKVVNAGKDAYMTGIVNAEHDKQRRLLNMVKDVCTVKEDAIRQQRENLRKLAETLQTSDSKVLTLKQQSIIQDYGSLRKELLAISSDLRRIQWELKV